MGGGSASLISKSAISRIMHLGSERPPLDRLSANKQHGAEASCVKHIQEAAKVVFVSTEARAAIDA